MNPITNAKNQNLMNERELRLGYTGTLSSWHRQYKDSAWIFIGGLNYDLTEGDVICVFSQYGEVVNINLVRDRKTGQSKGFCFLCYEDQRSTVLATDNLNGIKLAGRTIRVDHVEQYKVPKEGTSDVGLGKKSVKRSVDTKDADAVAVFVREHGCGPEVMKELKKIEKQQEVAEEENKRRRAIRQGRNESPPRPRNISSSTPQLDAYLVKQEGVREGAGRRSRKDTGRNASLSPPRERRKLSPHRIKVESPFSSSRRDRSPHSLRPHRESPSHRTERRR
ncbi:unnamed protein product [Calicophoron daubneyi]|uniref:RNA-binding motif protein, X-linked 2 n=1 Tax=Calicophoron daubneyi TaxID=300641 RepID=A0AAV2TJG8_CALDB